MESYEACLTYHTLFNGMQLAKYFYVYNTATYTLHSNLYVFVNTV